MNTYNRACSAYKTGFISFHDSDRALQGLSSQRISNLCLPALQNYECKFLANPYYNNVFFPIRLPYVEYKTYVPSNSCACVRNIQAP